MVTYRRSLIVLTLLVVCLALTAVPGCGSNDLESPTAARLRGLATLYLDYAAARNGTGPAGEPEFKKHLRSQPDFVLQMNGVDPKAPDAVFASDRDQEPFVIVYGVSISGMTGTSAPLIAHEKTGKNGKRLVVFANTKVEQVDDARLQDLTTAKQ